MRTLFIDLGTCTGWVLQPDNGPLESGTFCLATADELELQRRSGGERNLDMRFGRLYEFVVGHIHQGVGRIVFEDVLFAGSQAQVQLWASLRAALWAAVHEHPAVIIRRVPSGTLKNFATGNGHARKSDMARALVECDAVGYPKIAGDLVVKADGSLADDNEVDAIWLARFTAAVDRGEQDFLGVHQRRQLRKTERRRKRAEARARKRAAKMADAATAQTINAAVRSLGRCCGRLRRYHRRRAFCPACGSSVALPKLDSASGAASAPRAWAGPDL
jgi:hypothetical protein